MGLTHNIKSIKQELKTYMVFDLRGKNALVTGATGGIGQAIVKILYEAGAKVVAAGTKTKVLERLQDQFPGLECINSRLQDPEEAANLFDKAEELAGDVNILICNAGICHDNLAVRMKDAEWDEVLNLNLTSSFRLNKAAIKKMIKKQFGRIINISSIVGVTGNAGQANYSASKAGLIGMSKSLALEVAARGVTINCIAPGFIDTPMTEILKAEVKEALNNKIPMKRIGTPEEVASAVLYLASVEASYITGHTLHVNGGMLMC